MSGRWLGAALIATAGYSLSASVRAEEAAPASDSPSTAECARAYEQAQEQRKSGQLVAARDALRLCSRDECPDFIHSDCVSWHGEVQAELPTLVFSATSQGRDLADVTVAVGGKVLATRLEGQVLELDPGEYDVRFSAPGMVPQVVRFVVARGERNRLLRVELVPVAAKVPPPAPVVVVPTSRSLAAPAIFASAALVGVGGFVALGAWGRSSESKLELRCSPRCDHDEVTAVRSKYVLADVSLGVGVVSLALAAYTYFRASPPASGVAQGVGMQAGAGDVRMTYGGRF